KPPSALKPVAIVVATPPSRRITDCGLPKPPCPTRIASPRRTTPPLTAAGVGIVFTAYPETATTAARAVEAANRTKIIPHFIVRSFLFSPRGTRVDRRPRAGGGRRAVPSPSSAPPCDGGRAER